MAKRKTKRSNKPRAKRDVKWSIDMLVKTTALAAKGMSDAAIRNTLKVSPFTWRRWLKEKEVLVDALEYARQGKTDQNRDTLNAFIYNRLPPHLQEIWEQVVEYDEESNYAKISRLLEGQDTLVRQHLFLQSLAYHGFNPSQAASFLCIPFDTVNTWKRNDPNFAELFGVFDEIRKDFYEEALVQACRAGEVGAIIHANKTKNRDRGYNEKHEIEVNGNLTMGLPPNSLVLSEDDIDQLPLLVRRGLLKYMQAKSEGRDTSDLGTLEGQVTKRITKED